MLNNYHIFTTPGLLQQHLFVKSTILKTIVDPIKIIKFTSL